jgi:NAD(P)-dependent dehydrogenase (short-subunit alcohol dehydrogenase family)
VSVAGKTVLVTGASRGIGAAIAAALGEAGAIVIAHYGTHRAGAEAALAGIDGDRAAYVQRDLAEAGGGRALWRDAVALRPRIDVLVVNAAVAPETPFDATDDAWDAGWEKTMRVNVLEPANLIREAVAHFRTQGGRIVISLSSWAAQQGSALPQLPAYAASKAAVKALTQTVARNFAKENVLAYVVAPGIVRTRMSEISAAARGGLDNVLAILPLGELVPPEEVASVVVFLAGGTCRHLTGATIDLNGAAYVR